IGTGTIGNTQVERRAEPIETYKQPLAQDNQISQRTVALYPATVMPQQAYTLEIEPREIKAKKGTTIEIKIKAVRQASATQAIAIAVAGQPANVTPMPAPIPEKGNEIILKLQIAGNAPTVTQNVIITGNLNNNVQAAPALTLTITD